MWKLKWEGNIRKYAEGRLIAASSGFSKETEFATAEDLGRGVRDAFEKANWGQPEEGLICQSKEIGFYPLGSGES